MSFIRTRYVMHRGSQLWRVSRGPHTRFVIRVGRAQARLLGVCHCSSNNPPQQLHATGHQAVITRVRQCLVSFRFLVLANWRDWRVNRTRPGPNFCVQWVTLIRVSKAHVISRYFSAPTGRPTSNVRPTSPFPGYTRGLRQEMALYIWAR